MDKRKRFLTLAIASATLFFVILGVFPGAIFRSKVPGALASDLNIRPTKADSAGVDLDTNFQITSETPLDSRLLMDQLIIEPDIDFSVNVPMGGEEVLIVPKHPLEPHTVYKFSLLIDKKKPLRWAFQTKGEFGIVSTLPRGNSSGVPVDTGIEINFSHSNFKDFEGYFSIEPKVEGDFERHKKTAVFLPRQLEPTTIYTVTIKKGLPLSESSEVLEEDLVFSFETEESVSKNRLLYFSKDTYEFAPGEKPLFLTGYYGWSDDDLPEEAKFSLYHYKDAKSYINALKERQKIPYWAFRSRDNYREDVSPLTKVGAFTLPTQKYDNLRFFEFPEPITQGYYLTEADIGGELYQFWFQVTDLGLYAAATNRETLIWVNNLSDKSPAAKADVSIFEGDTAMANDAGLAIVSNPMNTSEGVYATISHGGDEAVATILPWSYGDEEWMKEARFQESYWKYLYMDRSLYKPEDTVHFWGLVKPRESDASMGRITVEVSTGGWKDNSVVATKSVTLDDFVFTDGIELPKLTPGYYNLHLLLDDQILASKYFEVQTYSKPLYRLDAMPDHRAIFAGDTINFDVEASFFEGTPASKVPLNYYIDTQEYTSTDMLGKAQISYSPSFDEGQSRWSVVQSKGLYLSARLPEGGEILGDAHFLVLNNDIDVTTDTDVRDGTACIDFEWKKLTVDKVNSGEVDPWDEDAFVEDILPNMSVDVKVYREIWAKVEQGQHYDFINKKVRTNYHYDYRRELKEHTEFLTDDQGEGTYSFSVEADASYVVVFTATDFKGNPMSKETTVRGTHFYLEREYPWYHLEGDKLSGAYSVGEKVVLRMKNNESDLTPRAKSFLFYTARRGLQETRILNTPVFETTFHEELIPNFWARGVYFDGRNYHETGDEMIRYDKDERSLELKIATDKKHYEPKDLVQVKVEVKDKDGKPVKAQVNLNLVDEALYALSDQYVDLLGSLYADGVMSGIVGTMMTHESPHDLGAGAEHGGEGGSERKDFRDAILFETLITDIHGMASTSFAVPDNLTSWRITGQAITRDLSAATATSAVAVKLPFFVDMVLNENYLTGDIIKLPLRSFGSSLKDNDSITYESTLSKEGIEIFKDTLVGKSFVPSYISLPPLRAGEYQLTVIGRTESNHEDTLTLDFKVFDSLMTQRQIDFYPLDKELQIRADTDGVTHLAFSDFRRSQYLDLLYKLECTQGQRLDQKIAPSVAHPLLEKYFPESTMPSPDSSFELLDYQREDGGFSLLPYSDTDLELSAKVANLMRHSTDNSALAGFFYDIADDPHETRERSIVALYGLSSLGEPVLQELHWVLRETDLTVKETLYAILAVMELGDYPVAKNHLDDILENYGEEVGTMHRIKVDGDHDDILETTVLASIAGAELNYDVQDALLSYAMENRTQDILIYLEQLMFLSKALPMLPDDEVGFSYILEGKRHKKSLMPGENHVLLLTPEKLASLEFDSSVGDVGVLVSYQKPFEPPRNLGVDGVKVTRGYEVSGMVTNTLKSTDLIKVNISFEFGTTAPDGLYAITDFLPAGLKPVTKPYSQGLWDPDIRYPVEIEGQRLVFVLDKNALPFHYYARVANLGEFRSEPMVISHVKSGRIFNITQDEKVIIR